MTFPGWGRVIALGAALCFLAGVIGWSLAQPGDETFNDTDVGFLSDMSTHHLGAVNLGFDYLARQHDSLVGHFAREIVLSQSQELAIMNNLLAEAGNPARAGDDVAMTGWACRCRPSRCRACRRPPRVRSCSARPASPPTTPSPAS